MAANFDDEMEERVEIPSIRTFSDITAADEEMDYINNSSYPIVSSPVHTSSSEDDFYDPVLVLCKRKLSFQEAKLRNRTEFEPTPSTLLLMTVSTAVNESAYISFLYVL